MDVTQALRDAENALREFISLTLSQKLGTDWIGACGVSEDRVTKWRERKESELKRQPSGVVEERLIYYADFFDLKTILKRHWGDAFSEALGEWRTFEVYLSELEKLRDPDAHRRELLPHQKHLVIGISGEIRNRIVRHRSKMETSEDCFPRFESARDSLGNIWVPEISRRKVVITNATLRPGDTVEFVVTATDPEDAPLEYAIGVDDILGSWQGHGAFQLTVTDKHIRQQFVVDLYIRSRRAYHARRHYDDQVEFYYRVLPAR